MSVAQRREAHRRSRCPKASVCLLRLFPGDGGPRFVLLRVGDRNTRSTLPACGCQVGPLFVVVAGGVVTGGFGRFVLLGVGHRKTRSTMVDVGRPFVPAAGGYRGGRCERAPDAFPFSFASWALGPSIISAYPKCLLWGYVCMHLGGGRNLESSCSCILFLGD